MIARRIRFSVALLIAALLTTSVFAGQDDKNNKKKPKNSDVDNIGNRDINKGNILPTMSLRKRLHSGINWLPRLNGSRSCSMIRWSTSM